MDLQQTAPLSELDQNATQLRPDDGGHFRNLSVERFLIESVEDLTPDRVAALQTAVRDRVTLAKLRGFANEEGAARCRAARGH